MSRNLIHILLVEDEEAHVELIRRAFEQQPGLMALTVAQTLREAYDCIGTTFPDLIIADLRLPDGQGIDLLPPDKHDLSYPVVIMTSYGDELVAVESMKAGALDYIVKSETTLADMPHIAARALREWNHITERKRAEEALRESKERYELAARGANDGLWDWDLQTNRVHFSVRWKTMLGYEEHEIGDTPDEWFNRVHPEDLERVKSAITSHIEGSTPHFESEYRMLHKDHTYRWMLCRGLAVQDANGRAHRMAGSQTDITDRKMIEEKLFYEASHDSLTGLPNRALFLDHLDHSIKLAKRYQDYLFAVLFLDLDHFKTINDSLGHQIGDQLLIEISRRLEACIRPVDTVARLGGDEFAIILDHIKTIKDVMTVVDRIEQTLALPFNLNGYEVSTTVSIGITLSTAGYEHSEDALRHADKAMYRAKKNGRARHELFNASMYANIVAHLQLEAELQQAVTRREFRMYYQPIVSLDIGKITGVEVFLRWQHPKRGLVCPAEFIPLAEETGLIVPISAWLMQNACTQNKIWQETGHSQLHLAINLSALEFKHPNLSKQIQNVLKETHMAAQTLEVEITETTAMENLDLTVETLNKLSAIGLQISLDDFGTGHFSLGRLKRLPINALKIDRSFIKDMTSNPDDAAIIRAIIAMAHNLKLQVIAEGAETEEQLSLLKAQQCDKFQGYLFSHPVPAEAFTKLLQNGKNLFSSAT